MTEKRTLEAAEKFLSKVQSATIVALNAWDSGRAPSIKLPFEEYLEVNGAMRLGGALRKERDVVTSAFTQLRDVVGGKLPPPIERTPDIEPFFLP